MAHVFHRSLPRAGLTETMEQMLQSERMELKILIEEEVERQVAIAMKKLEKPSTPTWNPFTAFKNFVYPASASLPKVTVSTSPDNNPSETSRAFPIMLFDEFVNTYPQYNLDLWEFNFGILAAIQKIKYSEISVHELDRYIGMIPTYRHICEQAKAGKRDEPPRYTVYIELVARWAGYDAGVITLDKLNKFIASEEGKEIHHSFIGYADKFFFIADAGEF